MKLEKLGKEHSLLGEISQLYQLSEILNLESFLGVFLMTKMIGCNINALITAAVIGEEKSFNIIKDTLSDQIKHLFEAYGKILEERKNEKNKLN